MFDIGFSEIVVIAVVALIVIGPERLPKAARTLGHLFGRLQRYVNDVKSDINREIELDELRKLQKEVQTAAADLKSSVESAAHGVESSVRNVERDLNAGAFDNAAPARPSEPVALPNEPGGELADAAPAEPPRQPALPGFDKI
jgi:sec-independent protein translocase protein TatB